jgi:ABC-type transport system involved in cytochrome c biogenesis permease subunit
VITQYGSWVAPFVVSSVLLTIGGFMWAFLLDPAKSVVERGKPEVLTAANA